MSLTELPPHEQEFERTPPHDMAAEQCVLGGMLLSQDAIADVVESLRTSDFYRPAHQIIFDTILDLYGRGEPADTITVAAALTTNGEIGRIGGAPYLHTLMSSVPTAANAGYYARIVQERATLRKLVEVGTRIVQRGYQADGSDADAILDWAEAEVLSIGEKRTGEDYSPLSEIMPGALDEIEAIGSRGGQMTGVPTGFSDLDSLTNGLHPGQMIIIAARPAIGKALKLDTPLPTPTGWTTMGAVGVGDQLLGADGRPTKVVAATEVMHGRPCYEVEFSDGSVIVADADHQWRTTTRASRAPRPTPESVGRVRSTTVAALCWADTPVTHGAAVAMVGAEHRSALREVAVEVGPVGTVAAATGEVPVYSRHNLLRFLLARLERSQDYATLDLPVRTTAEIAASLQCDGRPNHAVEVAAAFDLPEADLPVHPYVLGVWLGCGDDASEWITCLDEEIVGELRAAGRRIISTETPGRHRVVGLATELWPLRLLGRKHVPTAYLRASRAQRSALLAGILDADGFCSPTGRVRLASPSAPLVDATVELVTSLGWQASVTAEHVPGYPQGTCHLVEFTPDEPVFRLPRKAQRQRLRIRPESRQRYVVDVRPVDSAPVRCVQVDNDDHMYLAGRACIPTHNSTLALDFARAASIKHGLTSAFFSLEMGRNEITMRLLSAEARVALHAMRSGTMQDEDWNRLARRMSEVAEAPLFIDDSPNMSMMEIRAKCRRLKQQHDLRLVVIDYLQLMTSGKRAESRQVEVSEFSRSLKLLAKELGVPVVALSQLNRGPEQRTDKKPMVSDLRESGSIEQDADMVILLHREDAYEKESPRAGEADLIVAKHRNGPTATVTVAFQGHYSRFVDMATG